MDEFGWELRDLPGIVELICLSQDAMTFLDGNQEFFELFDRRPGMLLLQNMELEKRRNLCASYYSQTASRQDIQFFANISVKDGYERRFSVEAVWLEDRTDGRVYLLSLTDVTDDLLLEAQLLDIRRRLETNRKQALLRNVMGEIGCGGEQLSRILESAKAQAGVLTYCYDVKNSIASEEGICEESIRDFHAILADIHGGKPYGERMIRRKEKNGEVSWHQSRFSTFFDIDGKPELAIITFRNVEQDIIRNLFYEEYLESEKHMPDNCFFMMEANLSEKTVIRTKGSLGGIVADPKGRLKQTIQMIRNQMVPNEVLETWDAVNDPECLRNCLKTGTVGHPLEMQMKLPDGGRIWVEEVVIPHRNPYFEELYVTYFYRSIQEKKEKEMRLLAKATRDNITGCWNRRAFAGQLEAVVKEGDAGKRYALLLVDLDGFAKVDQKLGREQSNHVLQTAVNMLQELLEPGDFMGRLEEDGFLIFLNGEGKVDRNQVERLAEQICRKIRRIYIPGIALTATVGIAMIPDHGTELETLFERADTALLRQKERKGNGYCCYTPSLESRQRMTAPDMQPDESRIYMRTFGYFEVLVDGQLLDFGSRKAKELLALLVDRCGQTVSNEELVAKLWEEGLDQTSSSRLRQVVRRLKQNLDKAGIGEIFISGKGGKAVDTTRFSCDLYQYLTGEYQYHYLFDAAYMTNYSWAENTLAMLIRMKNEA